MKTRSADNRLVKAVAAYVILMGSATMFLMKTSPSGVNWNPRSSDRFDSFLSKVTSKPKVVMENATLMNSNTLYLGC